MLIRMPSHIFSLTIIISLLFALPHAFAQDITTGLEGYWSFDTFENGVAVDGSSNGRDAVVDSGPPIPATGRIGNGLFFDGTTDLTVPWKGVQGNAPRTIVLWVKTTETGDGLVGWGPNNSGEKWHFRINNDAANGVVGAARTEYNGSQTVGNTILNDGQWHQVASVFEGEFPTDVKHYVDGVDDGQSWVGSTTLVINTTEGDDVSLGSRIQGTSRDILVGSLDEVRIYSRALGPNDIKALFDLAAEAPTAGLRTFSADSVVVGNAITVTLDVGGASGALTETVPDGWTASNASNGGQISGNTITWTLAGSASSVSYDATPTDAAIGGSNLFTGDLGGSITDGAIQVTLLQGAVGDFDFHADIGQVDAPGSADFNGDFYTVEGSGADIWGTGDEFHFVFKEMSGPFTIKTLAFADPFDSTNEWVKAGPHIRQDLTPGAKNYMALIRPDFLLNVQWRDTAGAASASLPDADRINPNGTLPPGVIFPTGGLELRRLGDVMQAYYEYETEDGGTDWALFDQREFPFDDPVLVGLAVTSHEDGSIAIGEFADVEITQVNFTAARAIDQEVSGPLGFGAALNVTVDIFQNDSGALNVVETPPAGWAVSNIQVNAGDAALQTDGSIVWTASNFKGIAQLTYDVVTPTPTDVTFVTGDFVGTGNGAEIQGDLTVVAKGFLPDSVLDAQDITSGLVGHWTMDDGSGTTAADSSSQGRNAEVFAGDPAWISGVKGTALDFDGDDALFIPNWYGIAGAAERTITAWIRSTDTTTHGIVSWGLSGGTGQKYHFRINSDGGNGQLGALRTEIQGSFNIGSTVVSDGEWHFVASTFPVEGGVMLDVTHYVDGFLEDTKSTNASGPTLVLDTAASLETSDQEVRIGMRVQGTGLNFFTGAIDEVRIYNRGLTNAEIQAIMKAEGNITAIHDFMLY